MVVVTKPCQTCGLEITGAPQRRYCGRCKRERSRSTIRQLSPGEQVPDGSPRRYIASHGYARLRWRVGKFQYVETYEHRVFDGVVTDAEHVHHLNRDRADNRPENLTPISVADHAREHASQGWIPVAATLYDTGMGTTKIAPLVGRDPATVYRGLRKAGIKMRPGFGGPKRKGGAGL